MKHQLTKSTLAANCLREISDQISEGSLGPGDYLPPQKELADQFGVGISTIREAVQALIAIGVLESHPGKGTWVRGESTDTLRGSVVRAAIGDIKAEQLYETRWVVEVALTGLAAKRSSPEDIKLIWHAQKDMEKALEEDDVNSYAEADLRFHLSIAKAARNQLLEEFYNLIHEMLSEALRAMDELPEVRVNGVILQGRIAEAVERHDPDEAKKSARDLLTYVGPFFFESQPDIGTIFVDSDLN